MKTLDQKLASIRSGGYTPKDFIIADAKDADMAYGLTAPGPARGAGATGLAAKAAYLQAMRDMTRSGLVDIMLTSASTAEVLVGEELFAASGVTPAVRLNDTTDIWYQRGAVYGQAPSRPFRSARLGQVRALADLGLYSVTFSNEVEHDLRSLEAYSAFRAEAGALGMRHFLEAGKFTAFSANFQAFDRADGPVDTVPFLEISKAMSRGIGYAGEGDVLTAALVGGLLAVAAAFLATRLVEEI